MASVTASRTLAPTAAAPNTNTTAARRNVGPLTTAFAAPDRCFDRTLDVGVYNSLQQGGFQYADDLSIFVTDARSARELCPSASLLPCLPHFTRYSQMKGPGLFFSPGLDCPPGWRTVANATASNVPSDYAYVDGIVVSTLLPLESAFICCPAGFDYVVNFPPSPPVVYCSSAIGHLDGSHSYWSCSGNSTLERITKTDAGFAITLTSTLDGQASRFPVSYITMKIYAPTVQLNRRPRDVPATLTASGPQTGGTGASAQDRAPAPGGGAVAGIVTGVACLFLILAGLFALFWNRRRRRHQADADAGWNKPELDGTVGADASRVRPELEARERHELDATGSHQVFELDEGRLHRSELSGNESAEHEARERRWSYKRLGWI